MKVSGQLLKIEHRQGSFNDRENPGQVIAYDFTLLHILDGVAVTIVRLPKEVNALDLPISEGDDISVSASVPVGTKVMYSGMA